MEKMSVVKIPVNYVIIDPKTYKGGVVYNTAKVSASDVPRYQENAQEVEHFVAGLDNRYWFFLLKGRIASAVDEAMENEDTLSFLRQNQWLLQFADQESIKKLLAHDNFIPETCLVDIPAGAYNNGEHSKLFYKKKAIPIWEKRITERVSKTVKLVFSDKNNTLEERLSSVLLSRFSYINSIASNYPWILMYLTDDKRRELMTRYDIPFSELSIPTGFNKETQDKSSWKLKREMAAIPDAIKREYARFTLDIYDIFSRQPGDIGDRLFKYCYEHSQATRAEDENELLRQNLWLLDVTDDDMHKRILKLLGVDSKEKEDDLSSKEIDIDSEESDHYQRLNRGLLKVFEHGPARVNDQELVDFIQSDYRVLKLWPWLINYVKDEKVKTRLFKN